MSQSDNKPGPLKTCLGCVVLCGLLGVCCVGVPALIIPHVKMPAPRPPLPVADKELQAERRATFKKLQESGHFDRLDNTPDAPVLWVTSDFLALPPREREQGAAFAFAFTFNLPRDVKTSDVPTDHILVLRHAVTGQRVGTYSPHFGLDPD